MISFDLYGFDVALGAAVDVALGCEISFGSLGDDLAPDGRAGGHDDAEGVAELD